MKKVLSTAVVMCIVNMLVAQSHVELGIKGGLNFANLKVNDNNDVNARTSFHLGGLAHFHLSKQFAIQPELLYSSQGAKYNNGEFKLGYINVPVLGQFMIGEGFRLETGPQFGFLVSAKSGDNDVKDAFKGFDLSWAFGAGYVTHGGFGVDARYNLGLSDISENEASLKNSVWQLGIFYQFRNSHK